MEEPSSESSSWAELTHECLTNILSRLTIEQRWRGPMLVCKLWHRAATDSSLFSHFDLEPRFESAPTESPAWWSPEFETKIDSMLRSAVHWSLGSLSIIRIRHCSDSSLDFVAQGLKEKFIEELYKPGLASFESMN